MTRPPAAQSIEALDVKRAMQVLLAMDSSKAADVLTEMGSAKAAEQLIQLDADARNCILESMAPRAAASMLVSMEDALHHQRSSVGGERRTHTPQVCLYAISSE